MKQTTAVKLLIWLFLTFFIPFLLGSSLVYWYEKKEGRHALIQNLEHTTKKLAECLAEPIASFSPQEGLMIAQMIALDQNVVEISVYSDIYQMSLVHIDIPERRKGELFSHEQRVFLEGDPIGKIRITVTANTIIKDIFSPFLKKILSIFLGMSVIGFLFMGLAFKRYLLVPMRKLLTQADKIGQGYMDEPFIWEGSDEFATLGKTIEQMREKLFIRFRKIDSQARTDQLTGISNRRDFLEKAKATLGQCRSQNKFFSLIMFDLDDFKNINDKHGHAVGDQVLNIVSFSLKNNLRSGDLFGRWGGEEFLLAICASSEEQGYLLAEKLRLVICNASYPMRLIVTASFGVAYAQEEDSFQTLLDKADAAMYLAKKQGKNQVVQYREDLLHLS